MDYYKSLVLNNIPLYKIMSLKWFEVMVNERNNTLLRPSSWEDPYEMNYSNSVIHTEHCDIPLDASHWFGQCWSLCDESAIMWQAFKKEAEPYVKIMVEAQNLTKLLVDEGKEIRIAILERIRYFKPTTKDYKEKLNDVMSLNAWPHNFLNRGLGLAELYPMYSLLTKRDVFKHEEEVRLLLFDKSSSGNQKFVKYPFDPTTISEVVVDPWTSLNDENFNKIKNNLSKYLPIDKTIIRKSELYCDSNKFSIKYNL